MSKTLFLLILLGAAGRADAGAMKIWRLKEVADAPVLVTGRVLHVEQREHMPAEVRQWNYSIWSMTAEIEVLRSRVKSGAPVNVQRMRVHFLSYDPSVQFFIGGMPTFPRLQEGEVMVLPLLDNTSPSSEEWRLMADDGAWLTIPARAEMAAAFHGVPTDSGRSYLLRELANALGGGSLSEMADERRYLGSQWEDLTGELMPLLRTLVGRDQPRWAEISTNLVGWGRKPRPNLRDLMNGKIDPPRKYPTAELLLAMATLGELKAGPRREELLIRSCVAEMPWDVFGAGDCLVEYLDNPLTTEAVRKALREDVTGSAHVAGVLVEHGDRAILPDALTRALKVVSRPSEDYQDIQGSVGLLRDFGTDEQYKQLADSVGKYQSEDVTFYSMLWRDAIQSGRPRERAVAALALNDRRATSGGDMRWCDLAVYDLERATKQHFGGGERKSLEERDEAVAGALAWIASETVK